MKLIFGFALVVGYCFWQDVLNKIAPKTPRTYDDLMKLPSFTEDEQFQEQLKNKEDEVG